MTESTPNNLVTRAVEKPRPRWQEIFHDGTLAEAWFKWIQWVLISGALYAIGKAADSWLFKALAAFSALLVLLYAHTQIKILLAPLVKKTDASPRLLRWTLLAVMVAGQFALGLGIAHVADAIFAAK